MSHLNVPEVSRKSEALQKATKEFVNHLESLAETYPLVQGTLKSTTTQSSKQFSDFLRNECILIEDGSKMYRVPIEKNHKRERLKRKLESTKLAEILVPRSFIVSLISEFDAYLGQVIRALFYVKPELLNTSEKNLSFSKLLELGSVEEAQEYIIEKEVETILRDSHTQQFKWLENKLDIKLTKDLNSWKNFIELTERRNLFVHNNGIVNRQYVSICKLNNYDLNADTKIGSQLSITNDYFQEAYRCVFEIGVKLSQVLWRKFIKDEIEAADNTIIEIIFDQIIKKDNILAIELSEFATQNVIKHFNQESKLTLIVNKALSYKNNGNKEKCNDIINSIDWSACSDKFKLASSILLEKFDSAFFYMKKIGSSEIELPKSCFRDWPLFHEFITKDNFAELYKEIFGEDFVSLHDENKLQLNQEKVIVKSE